MNEKIFFSVIFRQGIQGITTACALERIVTQDLRAALHLKTLRNVAAESFF